MLPSTPYTHVSLSIIEIDDVGSPTLVTSLGDFKTTPDASGFFNTYAQGKYPVKMQDTYKTGITNIYKNGYVVIQPQR